MSENKSQQELNEELHIQPVDLQQLKESTGQGNHLFSGNLALIQDVKVKLEVIVGQAEVTVGELFSFKEQSVVKLNAATNAPVDVRLDGKTIARGYLVVADDNFGVCINEILPVKA